MNGNGSIKSTDMDTDVRRFWQCIYRNKQKVDSYHVINDGNKSFVTPSEHAKMWQEHFNTLLNEQPDERERCDNVCKATLMNKYVS